MAGPFDRVPGIDHDAQLPLPVRERMAQNLADPSTPEGAELSATFDRPRAPRVAFIGDSITDQGGTLSGEGTIWYQASGFWVHALQRLGQRFDIVYQTPTDPEFGVSGATTTSLVSGGHVDALVAAAPDYAVLLIGTNDLTGSAAGSGPTIFGRWKGIADTIREAGIVLVACTVTPRRVASDTSVQIANHHELNARIRAYAAATPGVILCDWYNTIADPANGRALAANLGDDVHPNITGASKLGRFLAKVLATVFPPRTVLPNLGDPKNVAPSGAWTASHGNATVTLTTPAATGDDPRPWTQMQITAITSTDAGSYGRLLKTATVTPGERYQAVVEFETDSESWAVKGFYARLLVTGGPLNSVFDGYVFASAAVMDRPESGVFRTPVLTIPAGATGIQLEIRQYGVGTTRVRAEGIMRV